jgi:organic hydroperoxide reductase OsmC/OhrA
MAGRTHEYAARLVWDGNTGTGTASYRNYGRNYRVLVSGKPDLAGTADPAFLGQADKHNPEDLFLAAISACHMLSYLALCARSGIRVSAYEDRAQGRLVLDPNGSGRFEEVTLSPNVTIETPGNAAAATRLHDTAHEQCFIANSCRVPIRLQATVQTRSTQDGVAEGSRSVESRA